MRRHPERTAWIILWAAFISFCLLLYAIPTGLDWWLKTATMNQVLSLTGSAVLVQREDNPRLEIMENPPVRATFFTQSNTAQGTLNFNAPGGQGKTLASVTIYGDSQVFVERADSPRFAWWSASPHRIIIKLIKGRVRVLSYGDSERTTRIEIVSAPDTVTLIETPGSNASVESPSVQTIVTVREGEARVSAQGQSLTLKPDERAEVNPGEPPRGPLPTERNLIADGSFELPLGEVWEAIGARANPDDAQGLIQLKSVQGRQALNFFRLGQGWGRLGVSQVLNEDVRDFKSMRLQLDVYINSQSLTNCGSAGTECPVMVKIRYVDDEGAERGWLQGYFLRTRYIPNPRFDPQFGLTSCPSCAEIHAEHQPIDPARWISLPLQSENLLEIFRARGYPAALLQSITIYAEGHSFDSYVTQVQLLVSD